MRCLSKPNATLLNGETARARGFSGNASISQMACFRGFTLRQSGWAVKAFNGTLPCYFDGRSACRGSRFFGCLQRERVDIRSQEIFVRLTVAVVLVFELAACC